MQDFDKIFMAIVKNGADGMTRQLFDMLPIGISLYNKKGVLVAVNKYEIEMLGVRSKASLLGMNLFYDSVFSPEIQERFSAEDEFSLWHYYDFAVVAKTIGTRRSGRLRVFTRFKTIRDERGNIEGYVLLNMEDKAIYADKNNSVLSEPGESSGSMDLRAVYGEDHEIVELLAYNVEPQAAALLGRTKVQLEGENLFRCGIHMPYRTEIAALSSENKMFIFYYFALESCRYLRWTFVWKGAGQFTSRLVDITEHIMNNPSVSFSESLFRNVFDHSPVAIVLTDKFKHIEDVNPSFLRLTGIQNKMEIVGRIFPRGEKARSIHFGENDGNEIESDEVFRIDRNMYKEMTKDELFLRLKVQKLIKPNGTLRGYIYYLTDVTSNKVYEEKLKVQRKKAEEKNEMKSRFIQNMSHDIRTPLNAIVGFSQLLGLPDGSLTPEEKEEYSDHIANNSNMLMMLVDDILNISDVENGNYKITRRDVKCNELCANTLKSVEYRVPAGVKLYYTSDVTDEETIYTDGRRVQQVLINFLTNACKHTSEGEIRLDCHVHESEDFIHFSVIDTGEGVDPSMADDIFQRFTKLTTVEGAGLGLNICSTIAKKLGGSVSFDKTYTGGAKFDFYIPSQQFKD
ncbi:MAG: PAS domain-containing protein [Bacteroidaceae bacterium]|nr:PAS domain-containing protein [Bacteroidaceae bacterium]